MSINEKLSVLLEYESGDLTNIAGTLSGIAGSLLRLPFDLGKKITNGAIKIVSVVGKSAKNALDKLDIDNFDKAMGIKNIKDLDINLSKLNVESDEFGFILFSILEKISKTKNIELKKELLPIYEKHLERQIDFISNKLNRSTDSKEASKLYGSLISMIDLIPDKKSPLINDILRASTDYLDIGKENIRKKYEIPKEIQTIINKPIDKMSVSEIQQAINYYENQLAKLSEGITNNNMTINQKVLDQVMSVDYKVKELKNKLKKKSGG